MMRTVSAKAKEFDDSGLRLDASYYASTGVRALNVLQTWQKKSKKNRLDQLKDVCASEGLFIPGRFKRVYVTDVKHGAPYLTGGNILQVDPLEGSRILSRKYTLNWNELLFQEKMTLITCSGTIGNAVYVTNDFLAAIGSPDLIRVIANPAKILPGYLFAVLSSSFGRAIIQQKTYGAVIPHIEAHHIKDLPIPRLESAIEEQIHQLIEQTADLRVKANDLLEKVKSQIEEHVGFKNPKHTFDHAFSVGTAKIDPSFGYRLDSFGYIGYVEDALKVLRRYPNLQKATDVGFTFFNPPIFKRMFAESGYAYMSAVNFYNLHPRPERYLSKLQPDVEQYLIRKGMVIIQNAGQRYGLITKPLFITETLDGVAVTSDVVRISHEDPIENGYMCGLLSTNFGRRLALRYSYGTSIPRLDVPKFSQIQIPYPETTFRRKMGTTVVNAYEMRERANQLEDQAQALLSDALTA